MSACEMLGGKRCGGEGGGGSTSHVHVHVHVCVCVCVCVCVFLIRLYPPSSLLKYIPIGYTNSAVYCEYTARASSTALA